MTAIKIVRALNAELDRFVHLGLLWPDPTLPRNPQHLLELAHFPRISLSGTAAQRSEQFVEAVIGWDQESMRYQPVLCRILGDQDFQSQAALRKMLTEAFTLDSRAEREKFSTKVMRDLPRPFPCLVEKAGNASIACLELLGKKTWFASPPRNELHAHVRQWMSRMGMEEAGLLLLWKLCGCHTCFTRLRTAVSAAIELERPHKDRTITSEERALVLMAHHSDWSKARICKELGRDPSAHRRWPRFNRQWKALRAPTRNLPRGIVADGRLDAEDPESRKEP